MHTVWTIFAGILLLIVFLLFGRLWGAHVAELSVAALVFIPSWAVLSLANLWVGVHRAGYGVREELPVLAIVFSIPAAIAVATALLFLRK